MEQSQQKMDELLSVLNAAWGTLSTKPGYNDFNFHLQASLKEAPKLIRLEKQHPFLGIIDMGDGVGASLSTLSIIATISDALCGRRLAAIVDAGLIVGWKWYEPTDGL